MRIFKKKASNDQGFIGLDSEPNLNCSLGDLNLSEEVTKTDQKETLPGVPEAEEDHSTSSTEESVSNEENSPPHVRQRQQHPGMGLRQPSGRFVLDAKNDDQLKGGSSHSPKKSKKSSSVMRKAAEMGKHHNDDNDDDDDDSSGDEIEEFSTGTGSKVRERAAKQKTSVGKEAAASLAYHQSPKKRYTARDEDDEEDEDDARAKELAAPGTLSSLFQASRPRGSGDVETRSVSSARSSASRSRTGRLKVKRTKSHDGSASVSGPPENSLLGHMNASPSKSRHRDRDERSVSSSQSAVRSSSSLRGGRKQSIQRTRSAEDSLLPASFPEGSKSPSRSSVQRTRSEEATLLPGSPRRTTRASIQRTRSEEDTLLSSSAHATSKHHDVVRARIPSRDEEQLSQSTHDSRSKRGKRRSTISASGFRPEESIDAGSSHGSRHTRRSSLSEDCPSRRLKKKDKVTKESGCSDERSDKKQLPEKKKKKKSEDPPSSSHKERRPSSPHKERRPSSPHKERRPSSPRKERRKTSSSDTSADQDFLQLDFAPQHQSRKSNIGSLGRTLGAAPKGTNKDDDLSVSTHSVSRKASIGTGKDFLQIDFE